MGLGLNNDAGIDDAKGIDGRHSGNGGKSFDAICCSICLETVVDNGHRSWSKLKCGHQFHLDCVASEFNVKGSMQCPNCRETEEGQWLYSDGKISPVCFCQWIEEVMRRLRHSLNDDSRQSFGDAEETERSAVHGEFLPRDIAAKLEESRAKLEELRAKLEELRASMVLVTRLVWVTMLCTFIVFCIKVWQKWFRW